MNVIFIMF